MVIHPALKHLPTCIALLLLLPGCLITTQSYNHGKLLNPGERLMTHGFGGRRSSPYFRKQVMDKKDTIIWESETFIIGNDTIVQGSDTSVVSLYKMVRDSTRFNWVTYTLDYRVGVLRKYPFGKGLETGFHVETVVRRAGSKEYEFFSPPTLEIDTRFGLPDIVIRKSIFHHNVNFGWIVGYWVDNGWFIGYAAGWEFIHFIPYLSTRLFITATDAIDKSLDDKNYFSEHDRKWGARLTGGFSWKLPFNYSLLPEYLSPEISVAFPYFSTGQKAGISGSLGIRWLMGQ